MKIYFVEVSCQQPCCTAAQNTCAGIPGLCQTEADDRFYTAAIQENGCLFEDCPCGLSEFEFHPM